MNEDNFTRGVFKDNALTTQTLKRVMRQGKNWSILSDVKKESLEMIAQQIGRILNGDSDCLNSWNGLSDYAGLVVKYLEDTDTGSDADI